MSLVSLCPGLHRWGRLCPNVPYYAPRKSRESVANDIAGAVLWLASDLGSFVTGQIISVDGGICHHQPHYADMMDMMSATQG